VRQGRRGVGMTCGGRRSNEMGCLWSGGRQRGRRGMVRTGEAPWSLTRGPRPAAGGRGRGEVQGHVGWPGKKGMG
jgi:hypothetical protein